MAAGDVDIIFQIESAARNCYITQVLLHISPPSFGYDDPVPVLKLDVLLHVLTLNHFSVIEKYFLAVAQNVDFFLIGEFAKTARTRQARPARVVFSVRGNLPGWPTPPMRRTLLLLMR